jgi:hypothetical protein
MIFIRDLAIEVFNISAMTLKKVEDIKGVNRSGKSKDRQYNCQKKNNRTNNDLQNTIKKTISRASRTPLKIGDKLGCSRRVSRSCYTSGTRRVTLITNQVISHE